MNLMVNFVMENNDKINRRIVCFCFVLFRFFSSFFFFRSLFAVAVSRFVTTNHNSNNNNARIINEFVYANKILFFFQEKLSLLNVCA